MKKYYPKYTDAKRALREAKKEGIIREYDDIKIFDCGKQRKIRRYFIGSHLEFINL